MNDLEALANMEYPGRLLIIGKDVSGESKFAVYAITVRSPPNQARKFELRYGRILVMPTNEEELKKGDADLLFYPAMILNKDSIILSNGKQTDTIDMHPWHEFTPLQILEGSLSAWSYEADPPHFTPRIAAYVGLDSKKDAIGIIKREEILNGGAISQRQFFEFELAPGKGKLISTYSGKNQNPLPSFEGEPLDVKLEGNTPKDIAEAVYGALNPDFRVAVACAFINGKEIVHHIINRHGLEK